MKRIQAWFKRKRLKPLPVIVSAVLLIALIIVLIVSIHHYRKTDDTVVLIEDAEIRTGPNAAFPTLYKVHKGDKFKQIGKSGKWIEVESKSAKEKGWVAGWHTDLDIKADVDPNAKPLKNKTIVLDAGHGGNDNGAPSQTGKPYSEKHFTLKTAFELKALLEREGAKVKMTRTTDEYVTLEQRDVSGDVYLSLHNDALESKYANGMTVYWHHKSQEALAQTLSAALQKKSLLTDKGPRQDNFQVLRQNKQPAVLLELGYISNPTDEALINEKLHRHVLEHAIVDGLRAYFSN